MSWLTDDEQERLLKWEDGRREKRVPGPLTDKIRKEFIIAARQMEERQQQLEKKIQEHDGFIITFKRGIGALVKGPKT